MSGQNPNLEYALNVLGNASIAGVLDVKEMDIDLLTSESLRVTTSTDLIGAGTYIQWNKSGVDGESNFINQRGGGSGGFSFQVFNSSNVLQTTPLTISTAGAGVFANTVTCTGLISSGAISGTSASISGAITGTSASISGAVTGTSLSSGSGTITGGNLSVSNASVVGTTASAVTKSGGANVVAGAGSYMGWNDGGGNGKTFFANQRENGDGGFVWTVYNAANALQTTPMSLSTGGALAVTDVVKSTINTARYTLSAPASWPNASLTTVVNWTIDAGKSKGTALGYAAGVFTNDTGSDIVATVSWTSSRDANALGATTFYIVANSFNYAVQKVSGLDDACLSATFLVPSTETIRLQGFQDSGSGLNFATSTNMLCITYYLVN